MSGLDEARLMAWVDGELDPAERADVEAWLEETPAARETLEVVRARRARLTSALSALGPAEARVEEARARVAAKLFTAERGMRSGHGAGVAHGDRSVGGPVAPADGGARGGGPWVRRSALARAALIVLFLGAAGVSAAVPGSPVRAWLESVVDGGDGVEGAPDATLAADAAPAADAADAGEDMGLRVRPTDEGRLEIALNGLAAGRMVIVTLVDGERGAVYAPRAAFRSGPGRIDAQVGPGGGVVRVEIPRAAAAATLRVDGRVWLDKRGERVDFPGPEARVSADTIRFGEGG